MVISTSCTDQKDFLSSQLLRNSVRDLPPIPKYLAELFSRGTLALDQGFSWNSARYATSCSCSKLAIYLNSETCGSWWQHCTDGFPRSFKGAWSKRKPPSRVDVHSITFFWVLRRAVLDTAIQRHKSWINNQLTARTSLKLIMHYLPH